MLVSRKSETEYVNKVERKSAEHLCPKYVLDSHNDYTRKVLHLRHRFSPTLAKRPEQTQVPSGKNPSRLLMIVGNFARSTSR